MSAFHRVDDIAAMPARRLVNLALRLAAYKGVIRALAEREQYEEQAGNLPAQARPASGAGGMRQNRTVASDPETLRTEPAFAGQIEVKKGA